LNEIPNVPKLLSVYNETGFIYGYIEGKCLNETKKLPNDFFDKLLELLQQIHSLNIVYLDMNKRSNIIVGSDGQPYMIDFQISLHLKERFLFSKTVSRYSRQVLQKSDLYHIYKHKRKLCPDLLEPHEQALSRRKSNWIKLHRLIATPFRKLRRSILEFLHTKGFTAIEDDHNGGN